MDIDVQNARLVEYSKGGASDASYGIALADLAIKCMPSNAYNQFANNDGEDDPNKLSREELLNSIASIIPTVMSKSELSERINNRLSEFNLDLEEAYKLLTVESLVETAADVRMNLIAEADTQEKVQNNIKDLGEILKRENTPNIIQTIASTITKEIKRSNQEMNDIETKETNLVLSTSGDGDGTEDVDPFNILDGGGVPEANVDDNPEDDPENNNNGNSEGGEAPANSNGENTSEKENEIPEEISGEEGELYSEAIRNKYAESLHANIVYRIKNAVSKSFYKLAKDGEVEPKMSNLILGVAYGLIVFGYTLMYLKVISPEEYSARVEERIGGEGNAD